MTVCQTLKVTGNKAREQRAGRDIPIWAPGGYFPFPSRDGSWWALALLVCLARVGDGPARSEGAHTPQTMP